MRYRRAWQHLRPGGHLALWDAAHVVPAGGDTFFDDLQDVYDEIGEGLPPGTAMPRLETCPTGPPGSTPAACSRTSPRLFDWEITYTADEYIRLLDTFFGHLGRWPPGSATACTARSGAAWPSARTDGCAGTGARSCAWRGAALSRPGDRRQKTATRLNGAVPPAVTASG